MGIDIYVRWDGQTEAEKEAQKLAWLTTTAGARGYLREAYHGEPYATKVLCPEAFEDSEGAQICAEVLRDRLPRTLELAEQREQSIYSSSDEEIEKVKQSYRDFVDLCARKETETGKPVRIIASY